MDWQGSLHHTMFKFNHNVQFNTIVKVVFSLLQASSSTASWKQLATFIFLDSESTGMHTWKKCPHMGASNFQSGKTGGIQYMHALGRYMHAWITPRAVNLAYVHTYNQIMVITILPTITSVWPSLSLSLSSKMRHWIYTGKSRRSVRDCTCAWGTTSNLVAPQTHTINQA